MTEKVALITGAARRIGAELARYLHKKSMKIALHYHHSLEAAQQLCDEFNQLRPDSAYLVAGDLSEFSVLDTIVKQSVEYFGRLDVLINNASCFYPTSINAVTEADWDDLMNTNLKAPFFLSQVAIPHLKKTRGCIINITDTHSLKPHKDYTPYGVSKAGLTMLTYALAKELAPEIRVNAVAPGVILWPEGKAQLDKTLQQKILQKIPLQKEGTPLEIAKAVWYLIHEAEYTTGQVLAVDGGRSIS